MANVFIMGKKGSKSKLAISRNTSVKLYKGNKADAIVNYGLTGIKLRTFLSKYPRAKRIPILNKYVGLSKYNVIKKVAAKSILVPDTKITLLKKDKIKDWIEKRYHSSQGYGIKQATSRGKISGKYYQRMINDRRFELRVHAFLWVPKEEWHLSKRFGPADQIAWNFHQGGHFQSVRFPNKYKTFTEAKDISETVLKTLEMSFGAVDLIVDNEMKVYFIEVNSSPGFTEFSQNIYFEAMEILTRLSVKNLIKLGK